MSCEFGHHDGAYVLGALAPAERLDFERHLPGCVECSRAVQELAGLTGLLARVSPDVLESPPLDEPAPQTLLPALVREVRRAQRRRTWVAAGLTAGLAAAAALVVTIGTLGVTGYLAPDHPTPPPPPSSTTTEQSRPMVPLDHQPISADLAMTGVPWGTRLDLTCRYAVDGDGWGWSAGSTYALFVRTRDGRVQQVATWRGLPGRTMLITAATATGRDDIASAEVRTADGTLVLRLLA